MKHTRFLKFLAVATSIVFLWSAIRPHDYFTWFLEVVPAIIAAIILVLTRKRFRLTPLLYTLIAIHMCVLFVGGHYTYAEVPLFNWIRDTFHQARNNYDKVGHFLQGFVPAIVAREAITRRKVLADAPGCHSWSYVYVWRSARRTNCSNGRSPKRPARPPTPSSARKAIPGTRRKTCSPP